MVGKHLLPAGEGLYSCKGVRDWVLQQDRDPAHTVAHRAIQKYNALGFSRVEVLPDWPGNSPDLNPIENVWGIVLAKVQQKGCDTVEEFKRMVNREFVHLDGVTVKNIYEKFPERLRDCLAKSGDKTCH